MFRWAPSESIGRPIPTLTTQVVPGPAAGRRFDSSRRSSATPPSSPSGPQPAPTTMGAGASASPPACVSVQKPQAGMWLWHVSPRCLDLESRDSSILRLRITAGGGVYGHGRDRSGRDHASSGPVTASCAGSRPGSQAYRESVMAAAAAAAAAASAALAGAPCTGRARPSGPSSTPPPAARYRLRRRARAASSLPHPPLPIPSQHSGSPFPGSARRSRLRLVAHPHPLGPRRAAPGPNLGRQGLSHDDGGLGGRCGPHRAGLSRAGSLRPEVRVV